MQVRKQRLADHAAERERLALSHALSDVHQCAILLNMCVSGSGPVLVLNKDNVRSEPDAFVLILYLSDDAGAGRDDGRAVGHHEIPGKVV